VGFAVLGGGGGGGDCRSINDKRVAQSSINNRLIRSSGRFHSIPADHHPAHLIKSYRSTPVHPSIFTISQETSPSEKKLEHAPAGLEGPMRLS
jgi:hypothetical protein